MSFTILAVFLLPLVVGVIGTVLPAFNYLPGIGLDSFGLAPFKQVLQHPSSLPAIKLTLFSALSASLCSLLFACFVVLACYQQPKWTFIDRCLGPLLALPHAGFAVGFGFLIAPAGWLARLINAWVMPINSDSFYPLTQDPHALGLILTMIIKETPFFVLMIANVAKQLPVQATLNSCGSLGYHHATTWVKVLLPQIMPRLALPFFAVLAWSFSAVDVATIIGPTRPSTFSVLILSWFNHHDLNYHAMGAAGSMILMTLLVSVIALIWLFSKLMYRLFFVFCCNGKRRSYTDRFIPLAWPSFVGLIAIFIASAVILCIWSVAQRWGFSSPWPSSFTAQYWWRSWEATSEIVIQTLILGLMASFIAVILNIFMLELEAQRKLKGTKLGWLKRYHLLLYLPLLIPDIAFLFGVQVAATSMHIQGTWLSVLWGHLVFVLPYSFLTLAPYYRGFDMRLWQQSTVLGASHAKTLLQIKLPMLLTPLLATFAIGFAVSITLYLPTLFLGAGRINTLTTEMVALMAGADRRAISAAAILQLTLPLICFTLALLYPMWHFRHRSLMRPQ
ncbi:ABC transporter permease [Motilimonas pumila]|uniref:ABC transporter permease n=1 Tax=Motilimonas pumila TaxID=2303987 RepID=A0A418YDC8_9GAMM|nr:ABC transporter permease subunit [Motilimonas pumila]RJG42530.1 ABC transporter permease [Motilimonas pumila]